MRFRFSKMRSTTVLIFVLAFMATLYMTTADNLQCMCSCCEGPGCTKQNFPMFDVTPCTDELCGIQCKRRHAAECGSADSEMDAMCMPSMSASYIFNRYTTLGAFILAFIATVMFRI
jgi:hypothetical protein